MKDEPDHQGGGTSRSAHSDSGTSRGLGARVTIGAAWLVATRWISQLLNLVSTVVLARILVPDDFGVVALAAAYIALVEGLTLLSTEQALVRFRNCGRPLYDTAWTLAVLRGAAVAACIGLSAWPVAALMDDVRLEHVIAILALRPLILGLQNPCFIDFEKELVFSKSFHLQVGSRLVMVGITIGFALALRSYWALAIGSVVAAAIQVFWSYWLRPYRPRFTLAENARLFSFSAWLWGTSVVRTLNLQADKFVIGGLMNSAALGIYHLGTTLSEALIGSLTSPLARALYPSFALVAEEMERLRKNVLDATGVVVAVALPLGIGLALVAPEVVHLLLGPKWVDAIPIIEILLPMFALSALTSVTDSLVMARGRTDLLFYRACTMFVVRLGAVIPGVLHFGLMGAAYGWAVSHLVYLGMQLFLLAKTLEQRVFQPIVVSWRSWTSVVGMVLAVNAIPQLTGGIQQTAGLAGLLVLKIVVGGGVYCILHLLLWHVSGRPAGAENRIIGVIAQLLPGRSIA